MSKQNENTNRLNAMTDKLCRSRMYDEANKHKRAVEEFAKFPFIDHQSPHDPSHAYHDFLDGWRAAMTVTFAELLDENQELHGIVMDLCSRLMIRRCDTCRGNRVDDNLDDCKACDGEGYFNLPQGAAEKVIDEITRGKAVQ